MNRLSLYCVIGKIVLTFGGMRRANELRPLSPKCSLDGTTIKGCVAYPTNKFWLFIQNLKEADVNLNFHHLE
jgi:hypothetical protein